MSRDRKAAIALVLSVIVAAYFFRRGPHRGPSLPGADTLTNAAADGSSVHYQSGPMLTLPSAPDDELHDAVADSAVEDDADEPAYGGRPRGGPFDAELLTPRGGGTPNAPGSNGVGLSPLSNNPGQDVNDQILPPPSDLSSSGPDCGCHGHHH